MKTKILEILKERGETNLTDFRELIPESVGEFIMYLPMKDQYNQNVIITNLVSQSFIMAWNELVIDEKIVDWKAVELLVYLFDNSPIISGIPIATLQRVRRGKKACFLPTSLMLVK